MGKQQTLKKHNNQQVNQQAKSTENSQGFKNKNISKSTSQNNNNNSKQGSSVSNSKGKQKVNNQKEGRNVEIDQRFAKASYDPRFLRPKKEITKVKIDNRFSKMLTDPAFQNLSKVDKYGRKIASAEKEQKQNEQLKQFYVKEDEFDEEQENQSHEQQQGIDEQENLQQLQNDNEMDEQQQVNDQNQESPQVQDIRKWMDEYDEESSSLGDMPVQELIEDEERDIPEVWSEDEENVVKDQNVKATKRLALCNYDWMNIAAKDLMILFNSFKPASGFLKSIKVYQSIFGKEKMEQEEIFGPQGIWNDEEEAADFEDQDEKKKKKSRKSWKELLKRDDSSALNSAKLRAYEKQRLKYYYAVIECDSKKTADEIYKQCDGNHFQSSNLQFDLRFIPDDIVFDKGLLKEECNQMPVTGEVKNFVNRALGHSKVELTWQDPELSLPASLKKKNWGKMTDEQIDKIDWGTYLNEEDLEEDQNKKELFFQMDQKEGVPEWKKQCNKKLRNQNQSEKLVISFDSGFGPSKAKNKVQAETDAPSLKKQKKSKKQLWMRADLERKKKRQELALMTQNHEEQREKNFKVDLQDQRFKAVYKNPLFSIDPSNPKFDHKKSGNVFKQVVKRIKEKHHQ